MAPARLRVAGVRRASAPEQQAEDPGARANHGQRRGGPEREHPFEPTLHAGELLHQFDPELRQALFELRVELSPTSAPLGVELCESLLELCVELGPAPLPRGVERRQPLFEFRVEPGEVELVQLAQIGSPAESIPGPDAPAPCSPLPAPSMAPRSLSCDLGHTASGLAGLAGRADAGIFSPHNVVATAPP